MLANIKKESMTFKCRIKTSMGLKFGVDAVLIWLWVI